MSLIKEKSSQSGRIHFGTLRDEAIGISERNQRSVSFGAKKNVVCLISWRRK